MISIAEFIFFFAIFYAKKARDLVNLIVVLFSICVWLVKDLILMDFDGLLNEDYDGFCPKIPLPLVLNIVFKWTSRSFFFLFLNFFDVFFWLFDTGYIRLWE